MSRKATFGMSLMAATFACSALAAPKIGVFFDPDGHTCSKQIRAGDSGTMYVLAFLDMGPDPNEMMGVEFGIHGIPANGLFWTATYNAPPQGGVLGDPLGGGAALGFSTCRSGTRIVSLGTIEYQALLNDPPSSTIRIVRGNSNIDWNCPVVVKCVRPSRCGESVPNLPRSCAVGLESQINGSCTVDALESWVGEGMSAWPNPARGSADLRFNLSSAGNVELHIYDLAGRRVRKLTARVPSGSQLLRWDGRDDGGQPTASGIYFVHLRGTGAPLQCRLTLLR